VANSTHHQLYTIYSTYPPSPHIWHKQGLLKGWHYCPEKSHMNSEQDSTYIVQSLRNLGNEHGWKRRKSHFFVSEGEKIPSFLSRPPSYDERFLRRRGDSPSLSDVSSHDIYSVPRSDLFLYISIDHTSPNACLTMLSNSIDCCVGE
jgi:hypothetical protein